MTERYELTNNHTVWIDDPTKIKINRKHACINTLNEGEHRLNTPNKIKLKKLLIFKGLVLCTSQLFIILVLFDKIHCNTNGSYGQLAIISNALNFSIINGRTSKTENLSSCVETEFSKTALLIKSNENSTKKRSTTSFEESSTLFWQNKNANRKNSTSKSWVYKKDIFSLSTLMTIFIVISFPLLTSQHSSEREAVGEFRMQFDENDTAPKCLIIYLFGDTSQEGASLNGSKWIPSEPNLLVNTEATLIAKSIENVEPTEETEISISYLNSTNDNRNYVENGCSRSDFENNNNCFCMLDLTIDLIADELKRSNYSKTYKVKCRHFLKVNKGLIIDKDSSLTKERRKRSKQFLKSLERKSSEIAEYGQIDEVLENEVLVRSSDATIYAAINSTARIPCTNSKVMGDMGHFAKFMWSYGDNKFMKFMDRYSETSDGALKISRVDTDDAGNYTCTISRSLGYDSDTETNRFDHELLIMARPIFSVAMTVMYETDQKCSLKQADIIHQFLPALLQHVLCSNRSHVCSIEMNRPSCEEADEQIFLKIKYTVILDPLEMLIPEIDKPECDFNCQMKIYSSIMSFLIRNVETSSVLSVIMQMKSMNHTLKPRGIKIPADRSAVEDSSLLPQLIIGCPPGFGIRLSEKKICVVCPKNTFSNNNSTDCLPCPFMEYQPRMGSIGCIKCQSPIDDQMCRDMIFNYYFWIMGITLVLALVIFILLCLFYAHSKAQSIIEKRNKRPKSRRKKGKRKDPEDLDEQPLLPREMEIPKVIRGPKPPPMDF